MPNEETGFTSKPEKVGVMIASVRGKKIPDGILYSTEPIPTKGLGLSNRSLQAFDELLKRSEEARKH